MTVTNNWAGFPDMVQRETVHRVRHRYRRRICDDLGSAAHRQSARKTRVNALVVLRCAGEKYEVIMAGLVPAIHVFVLQPKT